MSRHPKALAVERDDAPPRKGNGDSQYARLRRSLFRRRNAARIWLLRRKILRGHREFPLWMVAGGYLAMVGVLAGILTVPFVELRPSAASPLPIAPSPETADQAIARLYQRIASGDYPSARDAADDLASRFPTDYRIPAAKGTIAVAERDPQAAWVQFSKAEQLAPNSIVVVMNLAEVEFSLGRYADAEPRYRRILAAEPADKLVLFRLYLCARLQQKNEAETYLHSPLVGRQSIAYYYLNAADALLDGRPEEARHLMEKARLLFPGKTRVYEKTLERLHLIPGSAG